MKRPKGINMTCLKCNYGWETFSTKKFVVCPNCLRKVAKVEEAQKTNNMTKENNSPTITKQEDVIKDVKEDKIKFKCDCGFVGEVDKGNKEVTCPKCSMVYQKEMEEEKGE